LWTEKYFICIEILFIEVATIINKDYLKSEVVPIEFQERSRVITLELTKAAAKAAAP